MRYQQRIGSRGNGPCVQTELGDPEVLVNIAGTNIAARTLDKLSPEDFREVVDVNLTGAFLCIHAFLPTMRKNARGTIINIISDAGLTANAFSGPPTSPPSSASPD